MAKRRKIQEYPHISLDPEKITGRLDFGEIFGRSAPVHIEIGSGKGTFILDQARAHPEFDYLGIEWARKYYLYTVDRLGRWQVRNVRMIRTDAAVFIAENLADESVDCFHVYFPDPWPKKRHNKRRFFCPENMENVLRCLKMSGLLRIATDHKDYFEAVTELMPRYMQRFKEVVFEQVNPDKDEWTGTNYERKYKIENREIYTMALEKIR